MNVVYIDVSSAACVKFGGANRVYFNFDFCFVCWFSIVSVMLYVVFVFLIV